MEFEYSAPDALIEIPFVNFVGPVKIVFDFKNNQKTVYINGTAVITDAKVSTTDVSAVVITQTRICQITNNESGQGQLCFDDYKFSAE